MSVKETRETDVVPTTCSQGGGTGALTERELAILDLEKSWWRKGETKEQAIRSEFGMAPTRYYLILNQLVDDPRAFRAEPQLVDRLRRLRSSRLDERR